MQKLCECGCGQAAPIATKSSAAQGRVKGVALRLVHGHHRRGVRKYASIEERLLARSSRRGGKVRGGAKLTPALVREIRERPRFRGYLKAFFADYGVTSSTIYAITTRHTWKDI